MEDCNDFSEADYLSELAQDNNSGRAWLFQTCTEFGFFMPFYPGSSVFPVVLPVEHQVAWCAKVFGIPNMTPDIEGTNARYGGMSLQATNVLFENGLLDPWHLLSITSPLPGVDAGVFDAGHCGVVNAASDLDPPSLLAARKQVVAFLERILSPTSVVA